MPTLADLCGVTIPERLSLDGRSLRPLLLPAADTDWPDRALVTDSQRVKDPIKWRKSSVMTSRWRLVNGKELYDIDADPGQREDVAGQHPEVLERLTAFYEEWWAELEPTFARDVAIALGHPAENPTRLTAHDWITTGPVPWNQRHIRDALNDPARIGFWHVDVVESGAYEIALRRWPREAATAIDVGLEPGADVPGVKALRARPGQAVPVVGVRLGIGGQRLEAPVEPGAEEVVFRLELKAGRTRLDARFITDEGTEMGAYYVYVLGRFAR